MAATRRRARAQRLREVRREHLDPSPTGPHVFCREVQLVWPEIRPYFDERALATAAELGLPRTPHGLAALVPAEQNARLAAALVRAGLAGS